MGDILGGVERVHGICANMSEIWKRSTGSWSQESIRDLSESGLLKPGAPQSIRDRHEYGLK